MSPQEQQLRFFVRLIRLEKILQPLPTVDDALTASFFGIDAASLSQVRAALASEVDAAARSLLASPEVAAQVDRLPFVAGRAVVGLGDSLTADAQSWFEVLARAYALRKPGHGVHFVNAGVSGDTTTQMLARMPMVAAAKPSQVICLAGTNDARRFGSPESCTQVSAVETERNFFEMRQAVPDASWLLLVPPAADHARMAASPFWASMQVHWDASDLDQLRSLVRRQDGSVLDLEPAIAASEHLLDDGLHLTLEGQSRIARGVIQRLAMTA